MKKFFYAFCCGMCAMSVCCFADLLFHINNPPMIGLSVVGVLFITGFICGCIEYDRKQRKKEEDEERQAEQDRTNELMREYLKKKLQEENEK